jgi:acyl carrier protein
VDVMKDVREFLVSHFDLRGRAIGPDDALLGSGVLDSMGLLKLVTFLEERYGFTAGDTDVTPESFGSLRAIQSYVEMKTSR